MNKEETFKTAAKEAAGVGGAAAAGAGSIFLTGGSFSAAGITGGLATLGLGSMLVGIGSVALIGIGAYNGVKYLLDEVDGHHPGDEEDCE